MKKRVYLADVIDPQVFKKGQANIIIAPCHSGKTTAAITKLAPLASQPEKVLFLIDTTAGKEALLQLKETQRFTKMWLKEIKQRLSQEWWGSLQSGDGIRIMTYHQLGYQLQEHPDFLSALDVVVCDEMHNLITYKGIEYANNKKRQAAGLPAETKVCETALKELTRASSRTENAPLVVVMTATVNNLSVALHKLNAKTECFDFTDKVTCDTSKKNIYYNDISAVLAELPFGERAIIYTKSISQMLEFAKAANDGWRNVCCLWSLHSERDMTAEQLAVRDSILKTRRIPDHIDILLINAAYETSINIENEDFQTMIIHSGNPDTRIQVRGRLRHDIETLYLYDPEHQHVAAYFPEEYYGRFLTSADTAEIVKIMNLKDEKGNQLKWPSISKALELDGVNVVKLKQKGVRGCILRKSA